MKKVISLVLTLCLLLALCLAGCSGNAPQNFPSASAEPSGQSTPTPEPSDAKPITGKTVAISVPTLAYEFFAKIGTDLEKLGKEQGFTVVVDSCDGDQAKQADQMMNYITMGVDYAAIVPVETTGCLDAMAAAKAGGVEVINLLGSLVGYEDSYTYSIIQSEYEVGKGAAEIAAAWIDATFPDAADGSIEVAIFEKNTNPDAINRSQGLYEIEKLTSKAKVVVNYDLVNSDNEVKAQEYADMMFLEYPNVKAVLCYQADFATGVDETALKQTNLDGEHFGIFSVDWTERLGQKLASSPEGKSYIRGTSACWVNLAKNIVDLINGELPLDEHNEWASGSWKVTPETLDEYLAIIS